MSSIHICTPIISLVAGKLQDEWVRYTEFLVNEGLEDVKNKAKICRKNGDIQRQKSAYDQEKGSRSLQRT